MDSANPFRIYQGQAFADEQVDADGCEFIDCTFDNTRVVYSGGLPFTLIRATGSIDLEFGGPAENTLNALRALSAFGGEKYVETIIQSIRRPFEAIPR